MIVWKIRITPEVRKMLAKFHPENKKLIRNALRELTNAPYSGTDLHGELSGFKSFKPKRFRSIYKISEESRSIAIYYIGHRRNVYEQFRKLLKQGK